MVGGNSSLTASQIPCADRFQKLKAGQICLFHFQVARHSLRDLFVEFFAAYDVGPGGLPGLYYRAVRA